MLYKEFEMRMKQILSAKDFFLELYLHMSRDLWIRNIFVLDILEPLIYQYRYLEKRKHIFIY